MRVLHILDHSIPLHSGYTFRTLSILQEQRRRGIETAHVTSPKQGACAAEVEDIGEWRFHRTQPVRYRGPAAGVVQQFETIWRLARRLDRVIAETRPDILHAHSPALNGAAALWAARRHGLPVVYEVRAFWEDAAVDHGTSTEDGLRYRATRALETAVLRRASAVTTICEGLRADILGRGIPADRVTVIPNAVDVEKFDQQTAPPAMPPALAQLRGKPVIGFIGSFYAYEGLALLVDSMPSIVREVPDARLLLVGGGPEEARLKAQVQRLGLADVVTFTGRVPNSDVPLYYDCIDVLAYPRLKMRLTDTVTPLKPLEAMARGRLVLASDVGGHLELIRQDRTGSLFTAGSVDALVAGAVALLRDPQKGARLRAAALEFVKQERNWPVSVGRYLPVYERLVGSASRAAPT